MTQKLFIFLFSLLLSVSFADARVACKRTREEGRVDVVAQAQAKLEEYSALSAEEIKTRTDEIYDYIGSLYDSLGDEEGHISQDDTGKAVKIANSLKATIKAKTSASRKK